MAAVAGRSDQGWRLLVRPRWLAWHASVVLATAGMLYLGDWQLHRALSGNELSWAYTFEWPLFAIFCVYFWVKSLRDELRLARGAETSHENGNAPAGDSAADTAADYLDRLKAEVSGHGKWHGWR